ncbi:dehydratase [Rhodococcus sp. 15-1154-1]|nr:MaoC family dehydratase [Rhodococcus sp. 15-1154-1]OZF02508.1 dehydratase [Rhodococcus sp. 15-1154-1]
MTGLYYEDWQIGEVIRHDIRRTVTETDNLLITTLTMNPQPLHLDAEFGKKSMYGERIVNSIFTLGLTVGIPVSDTTLGTILGNLAFEETSFPNPVKIGDTLRVETEAIEKRLSSSRPGTGIVRTIHRAFTQDELLVCNCRRAALFSIRPTDTEAEPA